MPDTIELLEAIGQDASLRYASTEALTAALEQAQASENLMAAVASGDSSRLSKELGHGHMHSPQSSQTGHEDEEPDNDEKGDEPHHPPAPAQDKSSLRR
jgi:hypothetical protein